MVKLLLNSCKGPDEAFSIENTTPDYNSPPPSSVLPPALESSHPLPEHTGNISWCKKVHSWIPGCQIWISTECPPGQTAVLQAPYCPDAPVPLLPSFRCP